ncbi:hypothetical protein BWI15_29605 [Kribbella sp. ALI-6-A]|uniref:hypothetical protein n=1 Tax=Kribbella sp. ALI-6-A TaxID=1933817 RepID=UPI00097BAA94|nr:hypothetical protein [Kribbella sp. ALI-6-A]ONI67300.1 hypothetical protein BWI15_29605 [Kribbella sp. ALI-6-A]
MAVLGIVLIVLAVLLGLGVAVSSTASTTMEVFGVDFGVLVPTIFFLGAAAGAVLMLGLWLTKKGLGRGYRRHKEVKELRQQAAVTPDASTTTTTTTTTVGEDTTHSGKHAADVPADVPPAGEREGTGGHPVGSDRLAEDRHTVADGPDTRQPR